MSFLKSWGIGRFVSDPTLSHTKSDNPVPYCDFTLAVNERIKKNDKIVENVHYFDFTIWDKAAEVVCKNFKKGDPFIVKAATPRQDRWTDNDGKKREKAYFRVDDFEFAPRPPKNKDEVNNEVAEVG